jgi:hypothetical protein
LRHFKPKRYHFVSDFNTGPSNFHALLQPEKCRLSIFQQQAEENREGQKYLKFLFQSIKCCWISSVDIHKMFFLGLRLLSCHASTSRVAMAIHEEEPLNQVGFVVKYDTKWRCMGFIPVHELWKYSIPLRTQPVNGDRFTIIL